MVDSSDNSIMQGLLFLIQVTWGRWAEYKFVAIIKLAASSNFAAYIQMSFNLSKIN